VKISVLIIKIKLSEVKLKCVKILLTTGNMCRKPIFYFSLFFTKLHKRQWDVSKPKLSRKLQRQPRLRSDHKCYWWQGKSTLKEYQSIRQ